MTSRDCGLCFPCYPRKVHLQPLYTFLMCTLQCPGGLVYNSYISFDVSWCCGHGTWHNACSHTKFGAMATNWPSSTPAPPGADCLWLCHDFIFSSKSWAEVEKFRIYSFCPSKMPACCWKNLTWLWSSLHLYSSSVGVWLGSNLLQPSAVLCLSVRDLESSDSMLVHTTQRWQNLLSTSYKYFLLNNSS